MGFRKRNGKVDGIAKTLAAACALAHVSFFTLFAYRVIGRAGFGSLGWAVCAFVALLGLGCNAAGYYLLKHGAGTPAAKYGYYAISASTAIAGGLLTVAALVT